MEAATMQDKLKGLFADLLGIRLLEVSKDCVRAALTVRPDLCTTGSILHGGAIMAFADTLGAIGTVMNLPPEAGTATIESKTNFIAAAPVDSEVIGECTPFHRGRRTMIWQTKISTPAGKLLAVVSQTQIVL